MYTPTQMHTYTHAYTRTHTHAHTRTHTHMHQVIDKAALRVYKAQYCALYRLAEEV